MKSGVHVTMCVCDARPGFRSRGLQSRSTYAFHLHVSAATEAACQGRHAQAAIKRHKLIHTGVHRQVPSTSQLPSAAAATDLPPVGPLTAHECALLPPAHLPATPPSSVARRPPCPAVDRSHPSPRDHPHMHARHRVTPDVPPPKNKRNTCMSPALSTGRIGTVDDDNQPG